MDPILEAPVDVGDGGVVMEEAPSGVPVIALPSALTGLHYFDGQAMREAFLTTEQRYRRALAALAARAGGYGAVSGLDVEESGSDRIRISAGVAVDGTGRVLQLPGAQTISMTQLIAASRTMMAAMEETAFTSPELLRCVRLWTKRPVSARAAVTLWVVCASWAEGARATRTGSVTREGIGVRAVPLTLRTPVATSRAVALDPRLHLRSLIASARFADEWDAGGSLVSGEGLQRGAWCLGAQFDDRREVPLAVVALADAAVLFADQWIVRRERHEMPAERYWAGLMRMRPRSAFLAQILQFQCQLSDAAIAGGIPRSQGCDEARDAIVGAASYLSSVLELWQPSVADLPELVTPQEEYENAVLRQSGGATRLQALTRDALTTRRRLERVPADRLLIRHGIVELPPAGYLPMAVDERTVNEQTRALMGEGVDLRFCIVHPDVIAAEVDAGQHMERISLLAGLDDPTRKPRVDIFVPDGIAVDAPPPAGGMRASLRLATTTFGTGLFGGAARREALATGGAALHGALSSVIADLVGLLTHDAASRIPSNESLWFSVRTDRAIETLDATEAAHVSGRAILAASSLAPTGRELTLDGQLTMLTAVTIAGRGRFATASIVATLAVIERTHDDAGDSAAALSRRVKFTAEMHWTGDDVRGSLTARLLADPTFGAQAQPVVVATIQKEWGDPAGRASVAFLAFPALMDLLGQTAIDGATGATAADTAATTDASFVETQATAAAPEEFVIVELIDDADVSREDNPQHRLATSAIASIQSLLETEATFARDAANALFPPAPAATLLVKPTRDWVAFRRRRDAQCIPWNDAITAGTRRFRVLPVRMPNVDTARRLLSAVRKPGAAVGDLLRGALVDDREGAPAFADFAREGSALASSAAEVHDAVLALRPGKALVGAVIASSSSEGPELLVRRVRELTPALAPELTTDPSAPMFALPAVPSDLTTLDADGVILLVTV